MESTTFDLWTRRVARAPGSRRGLFRLGLGGSLGLLGFGQVADDALACVRNGKECRRGKPNGNCCSGTCKRGKCRPTPGAAGCQVNSGDLCSGITTTCPNSSNPAGACVKLDNGKPFCTAAIFCEPCSSHSDCTNVTGGKCIKTCPTCAPLSNRGCVYPAN